MFQLQMDFISCNTSHYKDRINYWVVANETSEYDRAFCLEHGPRMSTLMEQYGTAGFIKHCFASARRGNSDAKLLINDYMVEEKYVSLLKELVDDNDQPVFDVIGIQRHFLNRIDDWSNETIREICDRFAIFDVPIHFTELTVMSTVEPFVWPEVRSDGHFDFNRIPSTPEGEEFQKNEVVRIYTMLFSHPAVESIAWWDLEDRNCWIKAPAGLLREDMSSKPAYDALHELVTKTWSTNEVLTTNEDGKVNLRGFRGKYRVQLTFPDGKTMTVQRLLMKGNNDWTINAEEGVTLK